MKKVAKVATGGWSFFVLSAFFLAGAAPAVPFESRPAVSKHSPARWDSLHDFNVTRYTLWIRLPFNNDSLYGHNRISAVSNVAGLSVIKLNAAGLTVDSAFCDQVRITYSHQADTLYLNIPEHGSGQGLSLDIFYRLGNRGNSRRGYYWYPKGYNSGTLHAVGYTMAEPQDARYWMPCYDEPWDKADSGCVLYVTVPDSYQVAGNGLLIDTVQNGGWTTWHWEEPHPITTYLMCFTASRFALWSDTAHLISGRALPLSYFIWPEDSAQSRTVFATVPAMVRLLDSTFGDYPFQKYGMAAVYPFAFGGMEHQTMTTIHRNWILTNSQTGILHELAHMWYGDLVTCGTWANIWLNEGFASYLQVYYDEWLGGLIPGVYMKQRFATALSGNANIYPIYDPPQSLLFDYSMEYAKGAWVLHMLRWVMGDSLFFPMMRAYADSFAYGNAVVSDFQRIAEQYYSQDLSWFFHQWLCHPGHPGYATVSYYRASDTLSVRVKIRQSSIDGHNYKMPLALACSTAAGISDSIVVWDSTSMAGDFLLNSSQPILRVMLDPDNWVLKEWSDSLPYLASTTTINYRTILIQWRRFTADTTIAGFHLYRSHDSTGTWEPYVRLNETVITDTSFVDSNAAGCIFWYYYLCAVNGSDTNYLTKGSNIISGITGGVAENSGQGLQDMHLKTWWPNPFKEKTAMEIELASAGQVTVRIYNIIGQPVRNLFNGTLSAGRHRLLWDGRDDSGAVMQNGHYFCRIQTGGKTVVRRMVKIR